MLTKALGRGNGILRGTRRIVASFTRPQNGSSSAHIPNRLHRAHHDASGFHDGKHGLVMTSYSMPSNLLSSLISMPSLRTFHHSQSHQGMFASVPRRFLGEYDATAIEEKWQRVWSQDPYRRVATSGDKDKSKFILAQFPYPSGQLHMGHVRVYSISDALARAETMRINASLALKKNDGKTDADNNDRSNVAAGNSDTDRPPVLHPMGWDAFGLPAENAARENSSDPRAWTERNTEEMKQTMLALGLRFSNMKQAVPSNGDGDSNPSINDDARLVDEDVPPALLDTSNPRYYRWTQSIFTRMHRNGLAYRNEAPVYWDPVDRTVLANEQVDAEGRSWRSGALAERRVLSQWFLKITDYADALLDGLEDVREGWPREVRRMQEEWIGKSHGAVVTFNVADPAIDDAGDDIEVFTTRPDTVMAATFVAVAADHPIAVSAANRSETVKAELEAVSAGAAVSEADLGKRMSSIVGDGEESGRNDGAKGPLGCDLGVSVKHPVTGELLPVYAADYVIPSYGTAAVMGVPLGDARDKAFARAHSIPARPATFDPDAFEGIRFKVDTKDLSQPWCEFDDAMTLIGADHARKETRYRLRDWLVSRQRRWGTPIPIVKCPSCGDVPVPDKDLPVLLPDTNALFASSSTNANGETSTDNSEAVLEAWSHDVTCPSCGSENAVRETDTMDTFVDSSWYYTRFADDSNEDEICGPEASKRWLPVDVYVGGREHAILHLLYARFIAKFLFDQKIIHVHEPFPRLLVQGMVTAPTYREVGSGRIVPPSEVTEVADKPGNFVKSATGEQVIVAHEKMSKSKKNGVDPVQMVKSYGADTTRLFVLFKAPPERDLEWDEKAVLGQQRWINRLWAITSAVEASQSTTSTSTSASTTEATTEIERATATAISVVNEAVFESHAFNVAIAALMKLSNVVFTEIQTDAETAGCRNDIREATKSLVAMLAPFAPHAAAEMWQALHSHHQQHDESIIDVHKAPWPTLIETHLVSEMSTVVVQVAGKKRATVERPSSLNAKEVIESVKEDDKVKAALEGLKVIKAIAPEPKSPTHRIVNFVVAGGGKKKKKNKNKDNI